MESKSTKTCSVCEETKPKTTEYYGIRYKGSTDAFYGRCKACTKSYAQTYNRRPEVIAKKKERYSDRPLEEVERDRKKNKEYQDENKKTIRAQQNKHRQDNLEACRTKDRESYHRRNEEIKLANKARRANRTAEEIEKDRVRSQKFYFANKERAIENNRLRNIARRKQDPAYRLKKRVSNSVYRYLMKRGATKEGKSVFTKLPYTPKQFADNLERQFDSRMTWDNYGSYWHIDHIHPQSLLPYDSLDHPNFQKCWALKNLRPLEARENLLKSAKIDQKLLLDYDVEYDIVAIEEEEREDV